MDVWTRLLGQTSAALGRWFYKDWRRALRWREQLRFSEETVNLTLAIGVGIIGGLVNLLFDLCFDLVKELAFMGRAGDLVEIAATLKWWYRLIAPAFGGMAAGLILFWGLRLVGRQGTSNLLEAVVAGDGRLPFRTPFVKAIASLLSIGTGASIGREGVIVQLSAALSSKCGQLASWPPYRLRLLVGCGAAAGIAAAYNAPVAGAVFAAQIVLGNFSMNLFAPLLVASVVSAIVSRSFFGIEPLYSVPEFDFARLTQLPWFLLLGLFSGLLGALFLKLIHITEALFNRLHAPVYARLALAGLVVGYISIAYPQVWGNGYKVTDDILHGRIGPESLTVSPMLFLLGLFIAKGTATLACVGSGTVGGVLTPTLFLGASLGSLFATVLHLGGAARLLPPGAFALVGMGSVLAATTHSSLLAIILVLEISLNYSLMPPLMLACAVSTLVARKLHQESVYTESLRIEGLSAERETARIGAATEKTVGDFMREAVPPVRDTTLLQDVAARFLSSSNNFLPVVDKDQRLIGMVALHDLKEFLNPHHEIRGVIAFDVMRPPPPCLTPTQRLVDALPVLLSSEQRNVPVVDSQESKRLIGAVARTEVLGLFSEAIATSTRPGV
jgi:CIC family chloride channel protein